MLEKRTRGPTGTLVNERGSRRAMIPKRLSAVLLIALIAGPQTFAQRGSRGQGGGGSKAPATLEVPSTEGIAWFGTWEGGLAEAERTGRPILLMSAAPQCHGVPGMW